MSFKDYYNDRAINEELNILEEDLLTELNVGIYNTFAKLVGIPKRAVYPNLYDYNYVIGSRGFGNLLNMLQDQVNKSLDGNPPKKRKIYAKRSFVGVYSNVNKLYNIITKNPSTKEKIAFWQPVEKINTITIFKTNFTLKSLLFNPANQVVGDIVLWDVMTKDSFDGMDDIEGLKDLGWEEGKRQYVVSTDETGAKFWNQLTGIPLPTWVTSARVGQMNDPYGFAFKDDIALLKNKKPNTNLNSFFITKDMYKQLLPDGINESVIYEKDVYMTKDTDGNWYANNPKSGYKVTSKVLRKKFDSNNNYYAFKGLDKFGNPIIDKSKQKELDDYIRNIGAKNNVNSNSNNSSNQAANALNSQTLIQKYLGNEIKSGPDEIHTDSSDATEKGYTYNFVNGGKLYVYKLKNPESADKTYKIAFDGKGKEIINKIPELNKIMSKMANKSVE